ncbi:hypothetical protein MSIBF_A840002 [groundwater metagenome]|uniref:Periplasmic copper-binding protein NosD beta helix domain-containing protein n=1 Tax=groundwater metagenome TaxID=717931 RepID=A0A098EFZ5_9ZZZZ
MDSSSNLSLLNNKILNNSQRGIYSVFSTLILINNSACNNVNFDIYSLNWFSSFGNNNTCDKADGWNDNNRIGCSYCCDGSIPKIYYRDFDSDGYGNLTDNLTICNITPPAGYVTNNTDCDDNNPSINLGATEICNGIDDNCNNQTDENNVCAELCYGHNGNGSCVIKSGENCSCINEALNDNLRCYIEVKLNNSIINWTETCVDNPLNFTNKIFDCQGHIIDGDDSGTLLDPTYGIYLYGRQNNTIKNCIVTDFEFGIYLDGSLNNIISNNTANSNDGDGIQLYASSNNTLANNTANSNSIVGIFLYSASNNIIINNTANSNDNYGIDLRSSSNNTATNNTMNSNAYGIYIYDNSNFNKILNNEISNNTKNGIAVSYRSKFYSGYRSSNNTIENNEILNNEFGIYIEYSSDNNITNNAINSNKYGIYGLDNSNFNQISNNEISNNNETGITISNCYAGSCNFNGNSNNTIEGNEILNNKIGIFSDVSNSTINNNTICNNTNLDFNSSAWLSSSGDNNSCNNSDGWNDANRTGCSYCCDGSIPKIYYRDFDSDGYGNLTNNLTTCNITPLSGYVTNNADCNDNNVSIHQGATEIPNNNIDENCDGSDAINTTCYADADNDNYTNNTNTITTDIGTCPSGYKNITAQDCDDNNASINPGATEICNGIDDNCNNQMDENLQQYIYFGDADNDNYGNLTNNLTTCNITPPVEYVNNTMDCNDNNASINPGATDIPNNKIDENCNGYNNITCYADADNDNYINNTNTVYNDNGTCLITSQDCDDNNASINPGATEICNGIDDNCNNQMDEGINCGQYSCSCSNCSECNEKLNNVSCSIVTLTSPILNHQGTCIDNPENFTDKIFDCYGNTIEGNKTKDSYGILLSKKSNSTIKNCIINGFDYGIYIYASSENKILNNTLNSNNYGIYVSSPNSLSCSGYGYVCIHSSYGDYVYSQIEKRFVLISGDEQSSNNEISNNHACENEILDISLNNENKNFGNNECDKISNNTNTIVFCSKNCSSSELQKTLFLYYCDYDADYYFSKSVSGYCFGNESCIPQNCLLNRGNDCNDNNVSINPNTQEIECNGIDENCDNFDKCGKRIWSSNKYNKEKNTFYSYQGVYVAGTGFNANSKIEIYISPHKNLINLSDFKIKKNITTDENGNFVSLLWNLPAWNELSILYYDIIADENLNGIYEDDEAIDALLFGFSIDPVWASDENGNPKETFCENEAIYVYGKGLPVKNKNITLYFIPDVEISLGSRFCYRGECINISYSVQAEIDENGNFRDVVPGWSNAKSGEYDIIPDLNNNGIFDEIDKKAMDDSYFIGFTVEKKFDFVQ